MPPRVKAGVAALGGELATLQWEHAAARNEILSLREETKALKADRAALFGMLGGERALQRIVLGAEPLSPVARLNSARSEPPPVRRNSTDDLPTP